MKFIGSEQIKHKNAVKDGNIVRKNRDNIITIPANTTISFGEMRESRGNYSIVMSVARDFGSGTVTKTFTILLR